VILRPLDDKVVIRRKEAENKSPGGVYLPDKAKKTPREGVIVAVGPGRLLDNGTRAVPQVKDDDCVLFAPFAGNEVEVEGAEYIIMSETDILGVLEANPPETSSSVFIENSDRSTQVTKRKKFAKT
jgi:chaperonin GroES